MFTNRSLQRKEQWGVGSGITQLTVVVVVVCVDVLCVWVEGMLGSGDAWQCAGTGVYRGIPGI